MSDTKPDLTAKLKHLDMLQAIVSRMTQNSFLLKGWSITLATAILGVAVKDSHWHLIWVALPAMLAFWLLDGYFLQQERCFRRRFDQVRAKDPTAIDFSMAVEVDDQPAVAGWLATCFSPTLRTFHGALCFTVLVCADLLSH